MSFDLRQALSHEAGPLLQFIKYAIVGGLATLCHIVAFYLSALLLFPCLTPDDYLVRLLKVRVAPMADGLRARRAFICNAISFTFSNLFCYLLNRLFVFKPGRHHWALELLLFFSVSAVSMLLGSAFQTWLIVRRRWQTTIAFSTNLVVALLINYAMRRFVIFNG